jgi:phospholipid/cholesterol/gamma-HCH transport system ATP-binding protein
MDKNNSHINNNDAVISIRDLKKSFNGVPVLNGIHLDVFKGENLAVLGRSGSGKSVLIKIISGLLKPDEGMVKVFGQEVSKLNVADLRDLRLKIGFSFQNSALYDSMSVKENLEFPLIRNRRNLKRKQVDAAVEEVLHEVNLSKAIHQMPSELSGGQKKRIGIARTLIMKPEIMFYDEPTAGLDPITSGEINNLIIKVQQQYNTSSIVITHDLTCAKSIANRVTMLVDGKFITTGSFEEVFNSTDVNIKTFYDYNFIK